MCRCHSNDCAQRTLAVGTACDPHPVRQLGRPLRFVGKSLAQKGDGVRQGRRILLLVRDGDGIRSGEWPDDHRLPAGRPAGLRFIGADGHCRPMPVGPPTMSSSGYHLGNQWSGDISVPHDGQFDMTDPTVVPKGSLTMEQGGDALVAQASEGTAGG